MTEKVAEQVLQGDIAPAVPAGAPPLKHGVLRIAMSKGPFVDVANKVQKVSKQIDDSGMKMKSETTDSRRRFAWRYRTAWVA